MRTRLVAHEHATTCTCCLLEGVIVDAAERRHSLKEVRQAIRGAKVDLTPYEELSQLCPGGSETTSELWREASKSKWSVGSRARRSHWA